MIDRDLTDLEALAAEYALGSLDAETRLHAQNLVAEDADFADLVALWEHRLAPLAEAVPELTPSDHVWTKLSATLSPRPTARIRTVKNNQTQAQTAASQAWRWAAGLALAAGIAIAAFVYSADIGSRLDNPTTGMYVAMLKDPAGTPYYKVMVEPGGQRLHVEAMDDLKPPPAKSYELWLLKATNKEWVTLGLIPPGRISTVESQIKIAKLDLGKGARIAVSLEPQGGAPDGRSMGPIVFEGDLLSQNSS